VTSEPPRGTTVATGLRQEAAAAAATTSASAVPPTHVPAAGDQAVVVEIPNDDAPPPGWGQWENWPAQVPEPPAWVLVMRKDDCVMPRQPTHSSEASSARASLPAPDVTVARPEREQGHAVASTRAQLQQDRAIVEGARSL
jgi:hypothetical protein